MNCMSFRAMNLVAFALISLMGFNGRAWTQCSDGCGAAVVGSYPQGMLAGPGGMPGMGMPPQMSMGMGMPPGMGMGMPQGMGMPANMFQAGDSVQGGPQGPFGRNHGGWGGRQMGYQLGGSCGGPHWYDFAAHGVMLKRKGGDGRTFMSRGIRGLAGATIVQDTNSIDYDFEAGFRIAGQFQTSALHSIEAIYLGGLDWDDRSIVTDLDHNLYSAFSEFGNSPFGGFEDADQASRSTLDTEAELDSVEINFRRAMATGKRAKSTLLIGFRYLRVDEALNHRIDVLPHYDDINLINREQEFLNYDLKVTNDLFGLQGGGEALFCLTKSIQIGAEGKVGVYGTDVDLDSSLTSSTIDANTESASDSMASFVSDGNVFLLWQIHPMFKFRAGYELLFIQDVGTLAANYDASARNIAVGNPLLNIERPVKIDHNDNIFYHGGHVGFELGW